MKKRLKKVILIAAAVLAAGLCLGLVFKLLGGGIPCVFHVVTGLKCPGCGNTTAVLALLSLDFKGALEANLMMPVEFAYIGWLAFLSAKNYVVTGKSDLIAKPDWLNVAVAVIVIGWAVVRNIIGM